MSATRVCMLMALAASGCGIAQAEPPTGTGDTRAPAAVITLADDTELEGELLDADGGVLRIAVDGRRKDISLKDIRGIAFRPFKGPIRVALVNIETRKKDDAPRRLDRIGANWEHIAPATPLEKLRQFDVVYFPAGWGKSSGLDALVETYHKYVELGGGLLFSEPDIDGDQERAPALRLLPYPVETSEFTGTGSGRSVVQYHKDRTHPLTDGIEASDLPFAYDYVRTHDPRWTVLAKTETTPSSPTLLVAEVGRGRVVLHTNPDDYGHLNYFKDPFVVRIIQWLARRPLSDSRKNEDPWDLVAWPISSRNSKARWDSQGQCWPAER